MTSTLRNTNNGGNTKGLANVGLNVQMMLGALP
jgi:hypothetical protein